MNNSVIKRSIVTSIILSFVTCGIYMFFGWIPGIANDLNRLENSNGPTGATVVLLTIVTCGLYGIYFAFQASKRIYNLYEASDMRASDNTIINVILYIFGFSIISFAIMQNDMNIYLDATND